MAEKRGRKTEGCKKRVDKAAEAACKADESELFIAAPLAANAAASPPRAKTEAPADDHIGQINSACCGCLRTGKALLDFARQAAARLRHAQNHLPDGQWAAWVDQTLAISAQDADVLMRFAAHPAVQAADVSPATEMAFGRLLSLLRLFADHPQGAEATEPPKRRTMRSNPACGQPPPTASSLPSQSEEAARGDDPWAVLSDATLSQSQRAAQAVDLLLKSSGEEKTVSEEKALVDAVQMHSPVKLNRLYLEQALRLKQRRPELFVKIVSGEITIPEAKGLAG